MTKARIREDLRGDMERLDDATGIRIDRRGFLKSAAALGLAVPAVSGLLAACGGEDDDTEPDTGGGEAPAVSTGTVAGGTDSVTSTAGSGEAVSSPAAADAESDSTPSEAGTDTDSAGAAEWIVALTEEPTGFDAPAQTYTFSNVMVETHMLEPLVDIQGPDLEITPILAESWETTTDTTWTFNLRQGVMWHNGDDFTSEDVKWTIERMADGPRAYMISQFETVEAPDPQTIVITTKEPFGAMIAQLTDIVILPKAAWEEKGAEAFNTDPVGTGPYRMVEWVRDQHLIMETFADWWRGTSTPDRLVFRTITDPATRAAELRSGGVHIIQSVPVSELESLNSGSTKVVNISEGRLMIYPFNMAKPPFDDVRVRQALLYGTDRVEIVDALLGEYGTLMTGPFTSKWMGFNPDVEPYPYDPEMAQQLLAEAGQSNLEFTWNITDGVFLRDREVAEALANQLREIGVTMNLQVTERATIQQNHQAGDFQLTSVAWGTRPDPDPMLQSIVASREHNTDDEVKGLIQQGRTTIDPEARAEIYQAVHRLMAERAHWLYVYAQAETFGTLADVPWHGNPTHGSLAINLFYLVDETY